MKQILNRVLWMLVSAGSVLGGIVAQTDLAATLEVLNGGVSVQRVNTSEFLPVQLEAIVGVGDTIRTDASGRARVTFFADGTDTELLPNTEYRIVEFEGDSERFSIQVEVLVGQTRQRLERLLDASSRYDILTPGITLVARGTAFAVRVEEGDGRSAMLVSEGTVSASADQGTNDVPSGFGVRAPADGALSDVVRATSFEELDAALDGCSVTLTSPDDTSLNVRQGAGRDFPRIGTVFASDVTTLIGVTESGDWYRIAYRGGFGWILSTSARVDSACVGLRSFPNGFGPEDPSLYENIGEALSIEDLLTPTPAAESTASP